jgi:hypothetical protein
MKTTNEVFKHLEERFKNISVVGNKEGWDTNDEETMIITFGEDFEGLYVWRFYRESGDGVRGGYLKSQNALNCLLWERGWFGNSSLSSVHWESLCVHDRLGLTGGPLSRFAMTFPEFKSHYEYLVKSGQIFGVSITEPEVKTFDFPERKVTFHIDDNYFQSQTDVDKYINTQNLKIVLADGIALSPSDSPLLQKIVKNLIDNRELVKELIKVF